MIFRRFFDISLLFSIICPIQCRFECEFGGSQKRKGGLHRYLACDTYFDDSREKAMVLGTKLPATEQTTFFQTLS